MHVFFFFFFFFFFFLYTTQGCIILHKIIADVLTCGQSSYRSLALLQHTIAKTLTIPLHSNLYVPRVGQVFVLLTLYQVSPSIPINPIYLYLLLGICLFSRHYITSTTQFKSTCTHSWVNVYFQNITSPLPLQAKLYLTPLMEMFILQTLHHLYHSIQIYMYLLLGNWLFSRHYITSIPQCHPICTPSLENDYFRPYITSTPPG